MDKRRQYTDYFGFDLGDGESAVAWMRPSKRAEPQMIELRGRKSVITALGEHPSKGMLIGEEACHAAQLQWLDTRFKSRYLKDAEHSGQRIEQFARAVLDILKADGRLEDAETACFFVGCPSGWNDEVRARYRQHFIAAGMVNCEIISESRAAFMFARESGELSVSDDLLTRPALIIDAGSSTTDFTYVADLSERSLKVSDFGEVSLGGGLIDRLVLEANIERSPQRAQIEQIIQKYRVYAARCELEARRVKEMYFTQQLRTGSMICESAVKLYAGRAPITLDISISDEDMRRILKKPLDELGGQSFEAAYRRALMQAHGELAEALPEIILLTGGASRMPLIAQIAQEIFPNARILRGLEPEYAIARGLCHALRIDQKTQGFSQAVRELIRSEDMEQLVMSRMPQLYEATAHILTDQLVDEIIPQAFALWRNGGIRTINDISGEITRQVYRKLENSQLREALRPSIGEWVMQLRPDIERLTDPICDEYDLPRTSLRLPVTLSIAPEQIKINAGDVIRMNEIKVVVDVAAAAIAAELLGGGGIALLAAGFPGLIAGFVVGLIAAVIGMEAAQKMLYKSDISEKVRKLFLPKVFKKMLSARRSTLEKNVYAQMMKQLDDPKEEILQTVHTIAQSIERQLEQMMQRAALLIR